MVIAHDITTMISMVAARDNVILVLIDVLLISSSLYLEFIAHSPYSLDIFALISHLASELLDMRVYGSGIAKVIIVPYIVEYLLSRQCHALVRDKY